MLLFLHHQNAKIPSPPLIQCNESKHDIVDTFRQIYFKQSNDEYGYIQICILHNFILIQSFTNTIMHVYAGWDHNIFNIKGQLLLEINTVGHMLFTSEKLPAAEISINTAIILVQLLLCTFQCIIPNWSYSPLNVTHFIYSVKCQNPPASKASPLLLGGNHN